MLGLASNRRFGSLAGAAIFAVVLATTVAVTVSDASAARTPRNAQQVVQGLAKALPIQLVITYTASSDPNHLLGRPNGYTSKAAFTDARVSSAAPGTQVGAINKGGSVEVFSSPSAATARDHYVQTLLKDLPILGSEYDYVSGNVLLRLSGYYVPSQAQQFKSVLGTLMKGKSPKRITNLGPTATTTIPPTPTYPFAPEPTSSNSGSSPSPGTPITPAPVGGSGNS
jgi:hypothetical protein